MIANLVVGVTFLLALVAPRSGNFWGSAPAFERVDYARTFGALLPLAGQSDTGIRFDLGLVEKKGQWLRSDLEGARWWFAIDAPSVPLANDRNRAVADRSRMARESGPATVDPVLVGTWRTSITDPAKGVTSDLLWGISAAGDYSLSVTTPEGRRSEKGRFQAKGGQWTWTTMAHQVEGGTYRILGSHSIETTGPWGTSRWTRVNGQPPAAPADKAITREATRSGKVLFEDDFRSRRNWEEGTSGACKAAYSEGGLSVENVAPRGTCEFNLLKVGYLHDRVQIEVSVRLRKGDQAGAVGLKFGRPAKGERFYTFAVSANGAYRLAKRNGGWIYPIDWTSDPIVKQGYGATNRLAVEIRGRTIECYVNGKYVGSYEDTSEVRGNVGLYLDMKGMEAVFSDLRVAELTAR